jgi:hypothetical protein
MVVTNLQYDKVRHYAKMSVQMCRSMLEYRNAVIGTIFVAKLVMEQKEQIRRPHTSFTLAPDVVDRLKFHKEQTGCPASEAINRLVRDHLASRPYQAGK